jgi:hypothetical protein
MFSSFSHAPIDLLWCLVYGFFLGFGFAAGGWLWGRLVAWPA